MVEVAVCVCVCQSSVCSSPGHQQAALQQAELWVLQHALHVAVETNSITGARTHTHTHSNSQSKVSLTAGSSLTDTGLLQSGLTRPAMIGPAGGLVSWSAAPWE